MLLVIPVLALAAVAPNPDVMKIDVRDAHVIATPAGGSAVVSMLLSNPTSSTLDMVGASTPLAGETTLQHYIKDSEGLVQIAPLTDLRIPAHGEALLASGGTELQLINLTQELKSGLELPLTLKFADGTHRVVRIEVKGDE